MAKERKVDLNELQLYVIPPEDMNNDPLIIMADERKVDLLQHPLCAAFTMSKWRKYGQNVYFFQLSLTFV